jgi:hypothetical protein
MKQFAQLLLAFTAAVNASPFPQAVTSAIAPSAPAPSGCSASFTGTFGMAIQPLSSSAAPTATSTPSKRLLERRASSTSNLDISAPQPVARAAGDSIPVACATNNTLEMTLSDTVMKDGKQRIGYIAANRQFQFDGPPQAGAIWTAGWSVCDDGAIALGGSKTFYQCLSGTFYNLYDQSIGGQCEAVEMMAIKLEDCGSTGSIADNPLGV